MGRDVDVDIYPCFVDKVRHNKFMSILEKIGVNAAERSIITKLIDAVAVNE